MKSKAIKVLIAALIIGVIGTFSYYGFTNKIVAATKSYKTVTAEKTNVKVGIQGSGSVYAANSKDVVANNSGVLKDLNVKVGDTVEAGSKLFTVESEDLRESLSDSQENLDKQKLNLASDTESYNDAIAKGNQGVSEAQNQLNNANKAISNMTVTSPVNGVIEAINSENGDRVKAKSEILIITDSSNPKNKVVISTNNDGIIKKLDLKVGDSVKVGQELFVSYSESLIQEAEKAKSNLDKQISALEEAKSSNKLAMDNLDISDAQIEYNSASEAVNKMTVTAPIGGIIVAVNNQNDDTIETSGTSGSGQSSNNSTSNQSSGNSNAGSGSTQASSSNTTSTQSSSTTSQSSSGTSTSAILTIADPNSMKVKVAVDELDIAKIKLGQKSEIRFDAVKDKVFEGVVEVIPETGTSSNNVTSYDVVVSITDPSGIMIGMTANVNVLVDDKEDTLAIPAEALVQKDGKKYVLVESGSSSASNLKEIKTGIENETYIEILEGVTEGEKLLVESANNQ